VFALGVLALGRTYLEYRGVRDGAVGQPSGVDDERAEAGDGRAGDGKG
jgi:hypothetical protein